DWTVTTHGNQQGWGVLEAKFQLPTTSRESPCQACQAIFFNGHPSSMSAPPTTTSACYRAQRKHFISSLAALVSVAPISTANILCQNPHSRADLLPIAAE